jgi:tripartite-type tricarboxylate transporter receptor subunit TctC
LVTYDARGSYFVSNDSRGWRPGFPAKSAHDVLNYVLANPAKVTFASGGIGATSHLAGVLLEKLSNSSMVHVPYSGSAPALQDIMGDRVDLLFDNLASSLPLYKTQRLRIVAVGSMQRIAAAAISVSITDGSFSSD